MEEERASNAPIQNNLPLFLCSLGPQESWMTTVHGLVFKDYETDVKREQEVEMWTQMYSNNGHSQNSFCFCYFVFTSVG